jgi:hypothetical protein
VLVLLDFSKTLDKGTRQMISPKVGIKQTFSDVHFIAISLGNVKRNNGGDDNF